MRNKKTNVCDIYLRDEQIQKCNDYRVDLLIMIFTFAKN
jgi:hypothetical protein